MKTLEKIAIVACESVGIISLSCGLYDNFKDDSDNFIKYGVLSMLYGAVVYTLSLSTLENRRE